MNGNYITSKEYSERYKLNQRTVQMWCANGRIEGAVKFGATWAIPENTDRPLDGRWKNGEWVGYRNKKRKRNDELK